MFRNTKEMCNLFKGQRNNIFIIVLFYYWYLFIICSVSCFLWLFCFLHTQARATETVQSYGSVVHGRWTWRGMYVTHFSRRRLSRYPIVCVWNYEMDIHAHSAEAKQACSTFVRTDYTFLTLFCVLSQLRLCASCNFTNFISSLFYSITSLNYWNHIQWIVIGVRGDCIRGNLKFGDKTEKVASYKIYVTLHEWRTTGPFSREFRRTIEQARTCFLENDEKKFDKPRPVSNPSHSATSMVRI